MWFGTQTTGRADSLDSATQLCTILDATGLLKARCAVSSWSATVGLLMDVSADQAKKTCIGVRDLAAQNELAFDIHWTVAVMSIQDPKVPLASCKLEKPKPSVQSFGLRPAAE